MYCYIENMVFLQNFELQHLFLEGNMLSFKFIIEMCFLRVQVKGAILLNVQP